jgi:hypothetical protein
MFESEVSSFRGVPGHAKVRTGEPGMQFCGRMSPMGSTQPPPGRVKMPNCATPKEEGVPEIV